MKAKFNVVSISLIGLVLLSGCRNNTPSSSVKKPAIEVRAAKVTLQEMKEYLTFNGVTVFQSKEDIRANVTGYISSMPFKIGNKIRSGQVFAYVRTKEQDALHQFSFVDFKNVFLFMTGKNDFTMPSRVN